MHGKRRLAGKKRKISISESEIQMRRRAHEGGVSQRNQERKTRNNTETKLTERKNGMKHGRRSIQFNLMQEEQ